MFLWLICLRLITVRLVTGVRNGGLRIALRGIWRSRRVPLDSCSVGRGDHARPVRDYGGYGIRPTRESQAYVANGSRGVGVTLAKGDELIVGSERPEELVAALSNKATGR